MNSKKISEEIIRLARQDPRLALAQANKLVEERPNEAWVWSIRSYIFETKKDFESAILDINKAIEIKKEEPAAHFEKAGIFIKLGDYGQAAVSLSDAIEIGQRLHFTYYESSSLFMRAFCYCKLGDFEAAERDLKNLDDDMQTWIDRLRSKADLVEACRNRRLD